jgi:hypothetical protein
MGNRLLTQAALSQQIAGVINRRARTRANSHVFVARRKSTI